MFIFDGLIDGGKCTVSETSGVKTNINKPELTGKEARAGVMKIAWPVLIELLLGSLFGMVDMIMLGNIRPETLSAVSIGSVGIANQPLFIGLSLVSSFNVGGTAIISRYFGSGKLDRLGNVLKHVILASLVIIIVPMVFLSYTFAPEIMRFLGAQEDVVAVGVDYFRIVHIGFFFQALTMCFSSALRGVGETKVPMKINLFCNGLNVFGNAILIYGLLGFPALGVTGAGISTALSQVIAMILTTIYVLRGKSVIKMTEKFKFEVRILKNLIRIGLPSSLEQMVLRFGIFLFTRIVASLGTVVFAAHQIALNILGLSFNPGMAFGIAASALVGQSLGENNTHKAKVLSKSAQRIGSLISTLMGVIFFFFGPQLVGLYTSDPNIIADAAGALKIIALVQPLQSSQFILAGALRGAGDTVWPLIATIVGVLFIRVGVAYVLVNFYNMGLTGAWMGILVDQVIRWAFILYRHKSGKWTSFRLK